MLVLGVACPYIQMCVIQMCVSSSSMQVLFGSIPGGLTERQSYGDTACINLDTCIFVAQAAAEAKITAPERKRKAAAQDQKKKKKKAKPLRDSDPGFLHRDSNHCITEGMHHS